MLLSHSRNKVLPDVAELYPSRQREQDAWNEEFNEPRKGQLT